MKCDKYDKCTYTDCGMCENCTNEMVQGLINKINTNVGMAQAISEEKIKGKWIVKSNGTTNHYACDKCGNAGDIQDKFCRECGADMRGDNNG